MKKYFNFFVFPLLAIPLAAIFPVSFSCSPARDAGVFRSLDYGDTWQQKVAASNKQTIAGADAITVKLDPMDSKIIYLGTKGDGLFKSVDGGDTWYRLNETNKIFTKRANVYSVAVDPQNTANIYVGTYQNRYGRLFRSPDGGKNWEEVYRVSREKYAIFSVAIDSFNPAIVYMGTAEGGFLKSEDYGKSWKVYKWFDDAISELKVNPLDSRIIYISTFNQGLYKSTDKGVTWTKLEGLNKFSYAQQMDYFIMDSKNPDTLYTGSQSGLLKSVDGGLTWQDMQIVIPPQALKITAVAIDSVFGNIYYAASNIIYRSRDNGQTWTLHSIPTTKTIKTITIDSKSPNVIYLGIQL